MLATRIIEIFLDSGPIVREEDRFETNVESSENIDCRTEIESRTDRRCQLTRSGRRNGRIVDEIIAQAVDEIVPFTRLCQAPTLRARDRESTLATDPLSTTQPLSTNEISKLLRR